MSEKMQIVHENDFKLKLFQNGFIQNAHATEKCIGYKSCKSYLRRNLTDCSVLAVSSLNSNRKLASLCAARPNSDIQL